MQFGQSVQLLNIKLVVHHATVRLLKFYCKYVYVKYVLLLLCLCILIVMYVLCTVCV